MNKSALNYHDLTTVEKNKIRNCSKWNFFSNKCKRCQYEFICAKDWKIEEWFLDKEKREKEKIKKILHDIKLLLNSLNKIEQIQNLPYDKLQEIKKILSVGEKPISSICKKQ